MTTLHLTTPAQHKRNCENCPDPSECAERRACHNRVADIELAAGITNLNTRRMKRVEAGVNVLLALALGVTFGLFIVFELSWWPW